MEEEFQPRRWSGRIAYGKRATLIRAERVCQHNGQLVGCPFEELRRLPLHNALNYQSTRIQFQGGNGIVHPAMKPDAYFSGQTRLHQVNLDTYVVVLDCVGT